MKVFVSYSRESAAIAKSVVADLESLGHEVWIDSELSGGQAWWEQILAAIRDCGLLVFLLHPQALASVACTRERAYAVALGKPILPLQVADGFSVNLLPPDLAQRQIIPYRNGDRAELAALARAISKSPPAPPLPQPLPDPPEVPASYLGALALRIDSPAGLSYQDQSAALVDLRKALREEDSRVDADILLGRLRKRRDLFAAISEEIDALRGHTPPPVRTDAEAPLAGPAAPPDSAVQWKGLHPAWWFTAIGAGCGLLAWLQAPEFVVGLILLGVGSMAGLLSGLAAGRDRRNAWLALAGAGVGMVAYGVLVYQVVRLDQLAVFLGGGPGAVLGALAGRLWRRFRPG